MRVDGIGDAVTVTFENGETVTGWLYGELPGGVLISLDLEGKNIRLISKKWSSIAPGEAPQATFATPEDTSAEKSGKSFSIRAAEITEQARAANENLARLVEKSSVDAFGSATRSLIDKLMLVSTIGAVIATVGVVKPELGLGPFKIDVHAVKFIPALIAITIVFYGASLLSLATADIRKWWATHRLSAATLQPGTAMILAAMAENTRIFREQAELFNAMIAAGEDMGEVDKDGVPLILKNAAAEADKRSEILKREHAKLLQPVERVRKQFAISMAIFVILPLMFGGFSICLLIYSMIRGIAVLSAT